MHRLRWSRQHRAALLREHRVASSQPWNLLIQVQLQLKMADPDNKPTYLPVQGCSQKQRLPQTGVAARATRASPSMSLKIYWESGQGSKMNLWISSEITTRTGPFLKSFPLYTIGNPLQVPFFGAPPLGVARKKRRSTRTQPGSRFQRLNDSAYQTLITSKYSETYRLNLAYLECFEKTVSRPFGTQKLLGEQKAPQQKHKNP